MSEGSLLLALSDGKVEIMHCYENGRSTSIGVEETRSARQGGCLLQIPVSYQ